MSDATSGCQDMLAGVNMWTGVNMWAGVKAVSFPFIVITP